LIFVRHSTVLEYNSRVRDFIPPIVERSKGWIRKKYITKSLPL
jgi:hypothetical protein